MLATVYFIISLIYFFDGLYDPFTESSIREFFDSFLIWPATIIFAVGLGSGQGAAFFWGFIIYLLIWGLVFLLTRGVSLMIKK